MARQTIRAGQRLTEREYRPGTVQLFLYNAAIWNAHRIHYDLPYAQQSEGHPALLVDGPLQGDWLTQLVYDWMEEGDELLSFQYSNRRAAYLGDVLTAAGEVTAVEAGRVTLTLRMTNQAGQLITQGSASVRLAGAA
ncbi:acyl dehydratase [Pseudomonas sp. MGal98]|uniref:acyl dehydratase n=1 Tax=Pseudomonas sp. MGal98 TaxID=3162460 RepID=UPI0032EC00E2